MKRFSKYKWMDECVSNKCSSEEIFGWLNMWVERARGMTADEMRKNNLFFCDEWMEEVDE